MRFQCVSVTPKAGISKATNKPYSMLVVDGILTDEQGVMKTCEVTFFSDNSRQAPTLVPGQHYVPVIQVGVSRDKKLTAFIETLIPEKKAEVRQAA